MKILRYTSVFTALLVNIGDGDSSNYQRKLS